MSQPQPPRTSASEDQSKGTQFFVDTDGFDPSDFAQFSAGDPSSESQANWSDPLPILTSLLPVLPVSEDMLPKSLRPWLIDIAGRMRCPLDFVASASIVMLSSLIGTRLTIKPKTRDDWTIVPNLWGAAIGDPSTMKTPSIGEVHKPLNRLAVEQRKAFEQELQQYGAKQAEYEAQKKVYSAQEQDRLKGKPVKNPVSYPEAPTKPTERRFMTNDATVEKVGDLLNENPTGLLQFRDELIGLLAGWERAGREQDRAFYLEAWNGNGSITIDRIGRGTTHVDNVCLSLFGGIQPSKLTGYLRAATEYDNDGFVQRLQLAVYPDKTPWHYTDDYPDKLARDTAFALIKRLVETDFSSVAYVADEYNRFPYTRFNDQAQLVFKEWITSWEIVRLPNESGLLLEHFTKYRSLMPSLALLFHAVNVEGGTSDADSSKQLVSVEAAQMAVKWCDYLESHARRIYGLLDTIDITAAKDLLKHLKAGDLKDGFKVRDVIKKGWSGLTSPESVDAALLVLIHHNWISEVMPPAPTIGRPEAPHYLLHPKLTKND